MHVGRVVSFRRCLHHSHPIISVQTLHKTKAIAFLKRKLIGVLTWVLLSHANGLEMALDVWKSNEQRILFI